MAPPIPSTGAIRFSDIQAEFGGSNPIALSEYFANAPSAYANGVAGIPSTGNNIRLSQFAGKSNAAAAAVVLSAGYLDALSPSARAACRAAFSLTRVSSNYSGPTINVRRDSDNATTDVFASSNGALGLAIDGTGTPLASWLSNAVPFVTTWFDQSGMSNHATQTTSTAQPYLSMNSNPVAMNFRTSRWFRMPNGTVPFGNTHYTVHFRHGAVDNTLGGFIGSGTYFIANAANAFRRATASYSAYWWTNNINAGTYAVGNRLLYTYNGSTRTLHTNGTLTASQASGGRNSTQSNNTIGTIQESEMLNGDMYYIQIYSAALASNDISTAMSLSS
jgi:hypothetical protein